MEVKLKSLDDKLSDIEPLICTDSDEDVSEDETDGVALKENHNLYDELRNLIADSQQKIDVCEKSNSLEDFGPPEWILRFTSIFNLIA